MIRVLNIDEGLKQAWRANVFMTLYDWAGVEDLEGDARVEAIASLNRVTDRLLALLFRAPS